MSFFNSILEKLGLGHAASAGPGAVPAAATPAAVASTGSPGAASSGAPAAPPTGAATPVAAVDVVARLDALAAKNPEKLNWKVSIVDLLKLLGLDSSLTARKQLAAELHCPAEKLTDSAQMNMWLHKTVLQKLADNGGNVPKELLG